MNSKYLLFYKNASILIHGCPFEDVGTSLEILIPKKSETLEFFLQSKFSNKLITILHLVTVETFL